MQVQQLFIYIDALMQMQNLNTFIQASMQSQMCVHIYIYTYPYKRAYIYTSIRAKPSRAYIYTSIRAKHLYKIDWRGKTPPPFGNLWARGGAYTGKSISAW